ncbi:MAG: hypothetical protein PVI82_01290 [Desulfobacterales bacterium]|jgi:hypothetical protein
MNDSDRRYLSRFALDPTMEYRWKDLYGFDFSCPYDDEMDPFNDRNILDAEDTIPEDDFLFKN